MGEMAQWRQRGRCCCERPCVVVASEQRFPPHIRKTYEVIGSASHIRSVVLLMRFEIYLIVVASSAFVIMAEMTLSVIFKS